MDPALAQNPRLQSWRAPGDQLVPILQQMGRNWRLREAEKLPGLPPRRFSVDSRAPTPGLSLGRSASLALTLDSPKGRTSPVALEPDLGHDGLFCFQDTGEGTWVSKGTELGSGRVGRAFQHCAPDPWGTPHANTEFIGFLFQKLKNQPPRGRRGGKKLRV